MILYRKGLNVVDVTCSLELLQGVHRPVDAALISAIDDAHWKWPYLTAE
jgi:hypothetical protein